MLDIFILEDNQERINKFNKEFIYKTSIHTAVDTAIVEIMENLTRLDRYPYIFLDHDLGGTQYDNPNNFNTGTTFAKFLAQPLIAASLIRNGVTIIVHSMNEPAAENMTAILAEAGLNVKRIPFINIDFTQFA